MITPHRVWAVLDRLASNGSFDKLVIVDNFQWAETELTDVNRLDWVAFTALSTLHVNDSRQKRILQKQEKLVGWPHAHSKGGLSSPKS